MTIENSYDDEFEIVRADHSMPAMAISFTKWDGSEIEVPCAQCGCLTALVQTVEGEKPVAILAMNGRDTGLFSHHTAEDLRQLSKSFERMAAYIEQEGGE